RSFLAQRGTAGEPAANELDQAYVAQARYLHLADAGAAAVQAARWVKAAGGEVCFDGTHFHPAVFGLLPWIDYLIVSRFFASEYAAHRAGRRLGRAAQAFAAVHESGPPIEHGDAGDSGSGKEAPTGVHGSSPPVEHGPGAEDVELLQGEQLLATAERRRRAGRGYHRRGRRLSRRLPGGASARLGSLALAAAGLGGSGAQVPRAGRARRHTIARRGACAGRPRPLSGSSGKLLPLPPREQAWPDA